MGAGASALNTHQSVELTKELKQKYDAYHSHGLTDEEIQKKLTEDYNSILRKVTQPATKVGLGKGLHHSRSGNLGGGGSKRIAASEDSGKSGGNKGGKQQTRRRSFDANAAKKMANIPQIAESKESSNETKKQHQEHAAPSPQVSSDHAIPSQPDQQSMTNQTSNATLTPAEAVVDHWDSVTTQPFCNICQMAFKSENFLQRHIKFSDLHTQNVKKLEASGGVAAKAAVVDEKAEPVAPVLQAELIPSINKQIDGVHFRLLYTGSKFFWRSQDNVDLHIYHHLLPHTIEVISYDTTRDREMNRIYLDYTCLWDNARHHYHNTSRDQRPLLDEESKRNVLTTYLLQRLQIETPASPPIKAENADATEDAPKVILPEMAFVTLAGDEHNRSPILEHPPVVLIPVVVTRRRRTNAEEIEATISHLADDRKALTEATGRAEKVASLVYSSASQIASKKWWADFNRFRKLWIWAIRRVIRQRLVAETKANLAERAAKKIASTKRNSMPT